MPAHYTAADALTYLRETLGGHLDWIHEALAEEYGLEEFDGEEYLPGVLSDVMSCLHFVQRELTHECVTAGLYLRAEEGQLYRPRTYSTGVPVYLETMAGPEGEEFHVTSLQHPTGRADHEQARVTTGDAQPTPEAATRRAGLRVVDGEGV